MTHSSSKMDGSNDTPVCPQTPQSVTLPAQKKEPTVPRIYNYQQNDMTNLFPLIPKVIS